MKRPADSDTPGLVPNRACRNCVQIKVKCIPLADSPESTCERCHRLGKLCTTPAPVPRSQRVKSTRVAQLEERVDQLTALLSSTRQTSEAGTVPRSGLSEPLSSRSIETEGVSCDEAADQSICEATPHHSQSKVCKWASNVQPVARSGSPTIFTTQLPGRKDGSQLLTEHFCPIYLGEQLENQLIIEFRTLLHKQFPFVVIPASMSNEEFKEEKPFTYWSCILSASHRDRKLHQTLHDEMMKAVGYRMLVACGKSLDLLQGLLVIVAWHHHISHYNPQIMNLLHLAQALLADLGIGKLVRKQDKIRIASDASLMVHGSVEVLSLSISMDERRALLGCFWLSSKLALTFNRIDPTRYSQHIDDCCEILKKVAEHSSDMLCVELVQLHRIFGKYTLNDFGSATTSNIYRSMFQDELRQFRQNIHPSLKSNDFLEVELLSSSLCFLEPTYTSDCRDKMDHFNALHACLESGARLIDVMMGVPNDVWPNYTLTLTLSTIQLLVVYARLSFFKSEFWDIKYAIKTVDFGSVLERLEQKYWAVHHYEGTKYPRSTPWRFAIYAKKSHHIRAWFEAKVAAEEATPPSATDDIMPNTFSETLFGNFDDSLWQDLMGVWSDY